MTAQALLVVGLLFSVTVATSARRQSRGRAGRDYPVLSMPPIHLSRSAAGGARSGGQGVAPRARASSGERAGGSFSRMRARTSAWPASGSTAQVRVTGRRRAEL